MPELPEVETIKRKLEKRILGKKIIDLDIKKTNVIKEPGISQFKKNLIGSTVKKIIRRAKVLIIQLDNGYFLIIHLRISGWILYGKEDDKARIVFSFSNGDKLNYMDQRLLGELRLRKDFESLKFIRELGPEVLDLRWAEFRNIIRLRKTKIKALLMDQSLIAGIGNIYAQEALFLAKISPWRPANNLSDEEAMLLHKKAVSVLREGIKYGGSSVDSYRNPEGHKGGMEERLKVYGRKGEPCLVCKKPIEKIFLGGRGTCYCSRCQQ